MPRSRRSPDPLLAHGRVSPAQALRPTRSGGRGAYGPDTPDGLGPEGLLAGASLVTSDLSERGPAGPWHPRRWGPVSRRGRWRRTVLARILAAVLVGAAVWVVASALLPRRVDPGAAVVVLVRDLPVGATLAAGDLRVVRRVGDQLPAGAVAVVDSAVGRVLSGPVQAGELLTSARFQGPEQLVGLRSGALAVGLPLADPALAAVLRPGDTVSVLVGGSGQVAAPAAVVLGVTHDDRGGLVGSAGTARVLVAVSPEEAHTVAAAGGPSGAAATLLVALRR